MIRAFIRAEFEQIIPLYDLEVTHRVDALNWIDASAPLFRTVKPDVPAKHLVSYFAVVDGSKLLLGHHRLSGLWLPPGGHVEPNENPRDTVRREALEELALTAQFLSETPIFVTVTETRGLGKHLDVSLWYVIKGNSVMKPEFDAREYFKVQWFDFDDIPSQEIEPNLGRFIAKLRKPSPYSAFSSSGTAVKRSATKP